MPSGEAKLGQHRKLHPSLLAEATRGGRPIELRRETGVRTQGLVHRSQILDAAVDHVDLGVFAAGHRFPEQRPSGEGEQRDDAPAERTALVVHVRRQGRAEHHFGRCQALHRDLHRLRERDVPPDPLAQFTLFAHGCDRSREASLRESASATLRTWRLDPIRWSSLVPRARAGASCAPCGGSAWSRSACPPWPCARCPGLSRGRSQAHRRPARPHRPQPGERPLRPCAPARALTPEGASALCHRRGERGRPQALERTPGRAWSSRRRARDLLAAPALVAGARLEDRSARRPGWADAARGYAEGPWRRGRAARRLPPRARALGSAPSAASGAARAAVGPSVERTSPRALLDLAGPERARLLAGTAVVSSDRLARLARGAASRR